MARQGKDGDKRPYFPFYSRDWRGDDDLQRCPLEAKGLWIEMLTAMYRDHARGRLVDQKGVSLTTAEEIASFLRLPDPIRDVRAALGKLEERSVFSRESDLTIYSRRAVRWYAVSALNAANASAGWSVDESGRRVRSANGSAESDAGRTPNRNADRSANVHAASGSGSMEYGSGSGGESARGEPRRPPEVVRNTVPNAERTKEYLRRIAGSLEIKRKDPGFIGRRVRGFAGIRYAYRRQLLLPLALDRERDAQLRLPLFSLLIEEGRRHGIEECTR